MSKLQYTFKANTEEELEKIRGLEVPEMEQAINAYYTITASSKFREIERLREKAGHDEAQAMHHRSLEIAKNFIKLGTPLDQIAQATGLTLEELEKYR